MANKTFYNEVLTYHNMNPIHKHDIAGANFELEGVNPSCGDDIILKLRIDDDGVVADGGFSGDGCAISQASADMMLELVIGKSKAEAMRLSDIFFRMIKEGHITEKDKEELGEAAILEDVAHMPARVKCAVLGWHTMESIIKKSDNGGIPQVGQP